MTRKLVVALVFFSQTAVAFAAPEYMLCFHGDGHVRVEPFEKLCCRGSCEEESPSPSSCPDEGCQDVPVVEGNPQGAQDRGMAPLEGLSPTPFLTQGVHGFSSAVGEVEARRPRSDAGPPPPGVEQHLLTVVLLH